MPESQPAIRKTQALLDDAYRALRQATLFVEWISPIGDVYYDRPEVLMDIKLNQSWR